MTKKSSWLLLLAVLWGLFIFANSLLPGRQSTELSDAVVDGLPGISALMGTDALTVLVRKAAHFMEYALLAGLTAGVFLCSGGLKLKNAGNLLFPCLLWAVADEFLQTFISGRTGLVRDIVLDFGGVLTGIAVVCLIGRLISRRKRKGAA